MSDRKQIPHLIYTILEKELNKEVDLAEVEEGDQKPLSVILGANDKEALFDVSKNIYHSMQVVLEFLDKGMKGLLSGDMSALLL